MAMWMCAGGPALAQSACVEPQAPPRVNGAAVNTDQLRAAVSAAKGFIAQSDLYQSCLIGELDAAKTQANADGRSLDPAVENHTRLLVAASEKTKERVGRGANTAIYVYKRTHMK